MRTNKYPEYLALHCPTCGGGMRVPLYRVATYIDVRKCKCGQIWVVKAEVISSKSGIMIHEISWTHPSGLSVDASVSKPETDKNAAPQKERSPECTCSRGWSDQCNCSRGL